MVVRLLGTSGCHLCDVAEKMVRRIAPNLGFTVDLIDIASDDKLVDQYGMQIPMLLAEKQELGWPFDEDELIAWLQSL